MSANEMNADHEMDDICEEELLKDDSSHNRKMLESLTDIKEVMITSQSSMLTMGAVRPYKSWLMTVKLMALLRKKRGWSHPN